MRADRLDGSRADPSSWVVALIVDVRGASPRVHVERRPSALWRDAWHLSGEPLVVIVALGYDAIIQLRLLVSVPDAVVCRFVPPKVVFAKRNLFRIQLSHA